MKNYQQHGDVLITRISALPIGAEISKKKNLAEGVVTGHAHRVVGNGTLYEIDGVLYLSADKQCTVVHEEHKPQVIEPGVYQIGIVKEYDPFEEEIRNVQD